MPRTVGFTSKQKIEYQHSLITRRCKGIMAEHDITQTALAEYLGITRMAVNQQLRSGNVTLQLLIALLDMTDESADELLKIKE